jgi:hypothetical protein
MSNPDLTFFLLIDNIKYEYFNKKRYIYDNNQLHANINISMNGKQIGNGEIILLYNHNYDENDSIQNYINCYNVPENDKNKILYISWMKNFTGTYTGIYLFKLICHIAKLKHKPLIILVPTESEGCSIKNDSCEYNINTNNKLNSYNIFDIENPYNTIDNTRPLLNCKLNRLYLNYGFTIPNKICHPYDPSMNQCFMICGIDRLYKIINLYLLMHFKPNTTDSLEILIKRKQIENKINLRRGKRISTLFNTPLIISKKKNSYKKKTYNKSIQSLKSIKKKSSYHISNNNENISRLFNSNEVNNEVKVNDKVKVSDKFNINNNNSIITFKYKNTINNDIQKQLLKVYTNKKNNLSLPRQFSFARIELNGFSETDSLIKKLQSVKNINKYNFNFSKFAYLPILKNKNDKQDKNNINITKSQNTGTYFTKTNKNTIFPSLNLGPVNPEKQTYFLKKGSGSILLNEIIRYLKNKDIKTLFLHATTPDLVPYYEKNGFHVFNEDVLMFEPLDEYDSPIYYGDQNSGPLMYMNL